MFETPLTVVGRIITDLRRRQVGEQEVISFRMASNSRRRAADGTWEPGNTLYITVNCWGKLVPGVGASLRKGRAVIAVGNVYTSEYDDKEGVRRSSLEMRAISVGPDLSHVIAQIHATVPVNEVLPVAAADDRVASTHEQDDTVDAESLPLPA